MPNEASLSAEKRFVSGVSSLVSYTPGDYNENTEATATRSTSMKSSLRSTVSSITCGDAVDQDGEVVDVYLQAKRDGAAAKRFFRRLIRNNGGEPRKIVTDKLRSYGVAHRELIPDTIHSTQQYENNRAEQSHEATRVRERGMRRFKSVKQARGFLGAHAAVSNLFNLGRHLVGAQHYRDLRTSAFNEWSRAIA